ncbi:MAG TPA: hypothetical protein VFG45_06025 [Candidatus Nitrosocosmicus sp.]|nr:hypothetical protein [Candidatus Nitrosocosmicus sp.]
MIKLNLIQAIFALSVVITTTIILNGALTTTSIQTVVAEQQGKGPSPPPQPDCSIYTLDGVKIFHPCEYPSRPSGSSGEKSLH